MLPLHLLVSRITLAPPRTTSLIAASRAASPRNGRLGKLTPAKLENRGLPEAKAAAQAPVKRSTWNAVGMGAIMSVAMFCSWRRCESAYVVRQERAKNLTSTRLSESFWTVWRFSNCYSSSSIAAMFAGRALYRLN